MHVRGTHALEEHRAAHAPQLLQIVLLHGQHSLAAVTATAALAGVIVTVTPSGGTAVTATGGQHAGEHAAQGAAELVQAWEGLEGFEGEGGRGVDGGAGDVERWRGGVRVGESVEAEEGEGEEDVRDDQLSR